MSGEGHPDVAEVVPQAGRMLLLARVLEHTPECTRCAVEVDRSELFRDAEGGVPAWVGLEYLAQCMAAHGGLAARARGEAPRLGLFLGARRVSLRVDRFQPGQVLHVTVRHRGGERGLVAFDGRIDDAAGGEALVEGRLNAFSLEAGTLRTPATEGDRDAS